MHNIEMFDLLYFEDELTKYSTQFLYNNQHDYR